MKVGTFYETQCRIQLCHQNVTSVASAKVMAPGHEISNYIGG